MSLRLYRAALSGMATEIAGLEGEVEDKVLLMLDEIGQLTVEYLQSTTTERRPPAYPDQSFRYAHPGHWADISGVLAGAYRYEVTEAEFRLALINDDPGGYGAILERRNGFWVLTGVTDPGGPVEKAMRQAIGTIAPDWTIVRGTV